MKPGFAYRCNHLAWPIHCFEPIGTVDSKAEVFVRDISEVIRKKQAQQAQLAQQIEALQGAVKELDAVKHLLDENEPSMPSLG